MVVGPCIKASPAIMDTLSGTTRWNKLFVPYADSGHGVWSQTQDVPNPGREKAEAFTFDGLYIFLWQPPAWTPASCYHTNFASLKTWQEEEVSQLFFLL